jgi:hypothetical protein
MKMTRPFGTELSWMGILVFLLFAGCYTKLDHPSVLSDGRFNQPRQDTSCLDCHSQSPSDYDPNYSWWMAYDSELDHPVGYVERPWWRPANDGVTSRWAIDDDSESSEEASDGSDNSQNAEPPVYQGRASRRHGDSGSKESAGQPEPADDDDKPAIEEKKKKKVLKKERKDEKKDSSSDDDSKTPGSAL